MVTLELAFDHLPRTRIVLRTLSARESNPSESVQEAIISFLNTSTDETSLCLKSAERYSFVTMLVGARTCTSQELDAEQGQTSGHNEDPLLEQGRL